MPTFCQHCAEAPCIDNCADDAIKTRDDGIVWIDPVACTGCGKCGPACPYDVIFFNEEAKMPRNATAALTGLTKGCCRVALKPVLMRLFFLETKVRSNRKITSVLKPETGADPR